MSAVSFKRFANLLVLLVGLPACTSAGSSPPITGGKTPKDSGNDEGEQPCRGETNRGPFCLVRGSLPADEFNDRLQLVRPDGVTVWTGWGTEVVSAREDSFVLQQTWTGSMGGPIEVETRFVLIDGNFMSEEDLKTNRPAR